ncbi:MAG: hypothetical protein LBT56_00480 [Prevotellaceae bacterium]|jgi:hypothetical protein|nr:hypothetical protein [Prevotellaceae bacterium]
MKRLLLILLFVFAGIACFAQRVVNCDFTKEYGCEIVTINLFGNVKVVTDEKEFVNFRVRIAKEGECCPDLFVKTVIDNADECGEWHFVKSDKDARFSVIFVEEFEDFTIRLVSSNPGSAYEDFTY